MIVYHVDIVREKNVRLGITAARAFADGLSAGIEAVYLGVREEGIGFDQIGGHPHNAGKELVRIRIATLDLHQSIFPFRRHGGGSNLFRQDAYKVDTDIVKIS